MPATANVPTKKNADLSSGASEPCNGKHRMLKLGTHKTVAFAIRTALTKGGEDKRRITQNQTQNVVETTQLLRIRVKVALAPGKGGSPC